MLPMASPLTAVSSPGLKQHALCLQLVSLLHMQAYVDDLLLQVAGLCPYRHAVRSHNCLQLTSAHAP